MTTFEIVITILAVLVVLRMGFFIYVLRAWLRDGFKYLGEKVEYCDSKLGYIKGAAQDIPQQLNNIEDNILDDLRDIRLAEKLGKTSPNVPLYPPCYAPDGICMNPYGDCINCPRRGEGGTWTTTSNKVETTNKEEL